MTSEDVIHSFYLPEFRLKQDVLPGRYTYLWFEPNQTGTFHLFCSQYCGTGHSLMVGKLIVLDPDQYQRWLSEKADGSMALDGRNLFRQLQCIACHSGNAKARAPMLEGPYGGTVTLDDGRKIIADDVAG
jgi:cytochrome c oxidase subunit 2